MCVLAFADERGNVVQPIGFSELNPALVIFLVPLIVLDQVFQNYLQALLVLHHMPSIDVSFLSLSPRLSPCSMFRFCFPWILPHYFPEEFLHLGAQPGYPLPFL